MSARAIRSSVEASVEDVCGCFQTAKREALTDFWLSGDAPLFLEFSNFFCIQCSSVARPEIVLWRSLAEPTPCVPKLSSYLVAFTTNRGGLLLPILAKVFSKNAFPGRHSGFNKSLRRTRTCLSQAGTGWSANFLGAYVAKQLF